MFLGEGVDSGALDLKLVRYLRRKKRSRFPSRTLREILPPIIPHRLLQQLLYLILFHLPTNILIPLKLSQQPLLLLPNRLCQTPCLRRSYLYHVRNLIFLLFTLTLFFISQISTLSPMLLIYRCTINREPTTRKVGLLPPTVLYLTSSFQLLRQKS